MPIQMTTYILAIVALTMALSGCDSYLARRDSISPYAGDTIDANIVAEVENMHPRGAANPNLTLNADQLARRPAAGMTPNNGLAAGPSELADAVQKLATSSKPELGGF